MMKKVEGSSKTGNGKNQSTEKEKKRSKSKRVAFPLDTAMYSNINGELVSAVNSEGLLITVPVSIIQADGTVRYEGYDPRKHLPLKKNNFTDIATFIKYQAYLLKIRGNNLLKLAADKEAKADRIAKFGDEQTRRKVQKIARMREQLEALQKQLQEEGIKIDDI